MVDPIAPPDYQVIARSGVFAKDWYCREYSVHAHDPLEDYCETGWRVGRAPNPYFDAAWYANAHPGSTDATIHALTHYVLYGDACGCRPVPFFDTIWYRRTHGLPPAANALAHFLRRRFSGAVAPVPDFDPVRHLRLNPHLTLCGMDPYLHWRENTEAPLPTDAEIITASGLFDPTFYLICNPDVREARQDPLDHYRSCGWRERRNPNLYFNTAWYIAGAGALRLEDENPLVHYYLRGEPAGFAPSPHFDPAWYAAYYALPEGRSALAHYLALRRTQSHSPNPAFDVIAYVCRFGHRIGANRDAFAHFLRQNP